MKGQKSQESRDLVGERMEGGIEAVWMDVKDRISFDEFRTRLEKILSVIALLDGLASRLSRPRGAANPERKAA